MRTLTAVVVLGWVLLFGGATANAQASLIPAEGVPIPELKNYYFRHVGAKISRAESEIEDTRDIDQQRSYWLSWQQGRLVAFRVGPGGRLPHVLVYSSDGKKVAEIPSQSSLAIWGAALAEDGSILVQGYRKGLLKKKQPVLLRFQPGRADPDELPLQAEFLPRAICAAGNGRTWMVQTRPFECAIVGETPGGCEFGVGADTNWQGSPVKCTMGSPGSLLCRERDVSANDPVVVLRDDAGKLLVSIARNELGPSGAFSPDSLHLACSNETAYVYGGGASLEVNAETNTVRTWGMGNAVATGRPMKGVIAFKAFDQAGRPLKDVKGIPELVAMTPDTFTATASGTIYASDWIRNPPQHDNNVPVLLKAVRGPGSTALWKLVADGLSTRTPGLLIGAEGEDLIFFGPLGKSKEPRLFKMRAPE